MDRHPPHLYKHEAKTARKWNSFIALVINTEWLFMYVQNIVFTLRQIVYMSLLHMGLPFSNLVLVMVAVGCLFYVGKFGSSTRLI